MQTSDQSGDNTYSTVSSDFNDSSLPSQPVLTTELPPISAQMERLIKDDGKRVVSSYENVYDGVPLDPQVNRLSLDASELEIGDRFDTKQTDLHLQPDDRTSSYEKVYDTQKEPVQLGESNAVSCTTASLSSALVNDLVISEAFSQSTFMSPAVISLIQTSSPSTSHACPIYVTVEEGLDKLVCDKDHLEVVPSMLIRDLGERSLSCETHDPQHESTIESSRPRHTSTPDMSSLGLASSKPFPLVSTVTDKGTSSLCSSLFKSSIFFCLTCHRFLFLYFTSLISVISLVL